MEKRRLAQISGRKTACAIAIVLGLVLPAVFAMQGTLPAQASNTPFNPEKKCSITVKMPDPTDPLYANYKDMPAAPAGLQYDLYKVASAQVASNSAGQKIDSFTFAATKQFASLEQSLADLGSEGTTADAAASKYMGLAQEAARIIMADGSIAPVSSKSAGAVSSGLDAGLYLMLVHANKPKDYLIEQDGSISTVANSKDNKFVFSPQLIAVPSKSVTGASNTADNADWVYDVEGVLKFEWRALYGSLDIVKTLRSFDSGNPVTFVFDIEGKDADGNVVYSNTASLVFNGATSQTAHIDQIPAGLEVTVKEVYTGTTYKPVTSSSKTETIVAEDTVAVAFENDYDSENPGGNKGGSVTNSFTYNQGEDGSDGQWGWSKDGEEQG